MSDAPQTTPPVIPADSGFGKLLDLEPGSIGCPFPAYRDLREQHPVAWSERLNAWVVSRYEDIREVLRDPIAFSSGSASGPSSVTSLAARVAESEEYSEATRRQARRRLRLSASPVLLNCDPPVHRRQRGLVSPAFTPRRVTQMEPQIQRTADELIDGFAAKGRAELIADFALPLPMTVIARILGVPTSLMSTFKRWSDAFTRGVGALDLTAEEITDLFQSVDEFYDYFTERLAERRAEPADDLLTDLLSARLEGEQPLTEDELLQMLVQFLVAGNETTTNLISSAMRRLLTDADLLHELRSDPDRIALFVEECLRLEAPTQGMFRTATADCEVGGQAIPAGAMLYLVYASGNRDENAFPDPDALVLDASRGHHLAFGRGEHVCLGANVARREALIAVRTLLDRLDGIRLDDTADATAYSPSFMLRSLRALPIVFQPAV
ncbi:cytochrome P450 [Actinomadura sp. LD22]|uniref:Cytochrome P450 n=1 Tax=Actinomadura physcomitrii TaxID=2650748 RepID=A0A6I4MBZ2_9ACTN|nr:cytochrome P450 [Actinomadura physcomitrii]MWA03223.1 cytochrome P450 [Actinomadura physcomitrii]